MGGMAEAMVAFARPLIDGTDGSTEQVQNAMSLGMLCYNLALLPEKEREETLKEMQPTLGYSDEEFEKFRRDVVLPMVARHEAMFPNMRTRGLAGMGRIGGGGSEDAPRGREYLGTTMLEPRTAKPEKKQPTPEPYEPCPCNSGKKYRFCCGKKK